VSVDLIEMRSSPEYALALSVVPLMVVVNVSLGAIHISTPVAV